MFVQKLQFLAAKASSRVLDYIGVKHHLVGVSIEVGEKSFMVEQGCSGISSLLSTLACVLFYVLWYRISWLRGSLLTLSSIFWVLFNNITRIVGITFFGVGFTVLGRFFSLNLSEGIPHQIFGVLLFLMTLFMLWSTDRFLMFLGQSSLPERRTAPLPMTADNAESGWRFAIAQPGAWMQSFAIAGLFGFLLLLQGMDLFSILVRALTPARRVAKLYQGVDADTMPEKVGMWTRVGKFETPVRPPGDVMGQYSRVWSYRVNPVTATLSLDYPYPEFHNLRVCYDMQGWIEDKTDRLEAKIGEQTLTYYHVRMHKPNERYADLWFCSFDQDGLGVESLVEGDLKLYMEKNTFGRAYARQYSIDSANGDKHLGRPTSAPRALARSCRSNCSCPAMSRCLKRASPKATTCSLRD